MYSIYDEADFKFDIGSSPLSIPDMRIPENDFQLACKSPLHGRIAEFSNVSQDLFSDFFRFDDTVPNLFDPRPNDDMIFGGTNASLSQNFDFPSMKSAFLDDIPKEQFPSSKDIDSFSAPLSSDSNSETSPTFNYSLESYCSQPDFDPFPNQQSDISDRSFMISTSSKTKDVKSASSCGRSQKLFKGQKLQRKCEVFQPFSSLASLESTVNELRKIMCDPAPSK